MEYAINSQEHFLALPSLDIDNISDEYHFMSLDDKSAYMYV